MEGFGRSGLNCAEIEWKYPLIGVNNKLVEMNGIDALCVCLNWVLNNESGRIIWFLES